LAYCGFFFIIIEGEFAFEFVLAFKALRNSGGSFEGSTGVDICFLIVAASGIPGIFSPGLIVRTLGTAGAPFEVFATWLAEGVVFVDGGTGEGDIPEGRLAGVLFAAALTLFDEVKLADGAEPQPKLKANVRSARKNRTALGIFK
jgi:hypothetical protein